MTDTMHRWEPDRNERDVLVYRTEAFTISLFKWRFLERDGDPEPWAINVRGLDGLDRFDGPHQVGGKTQEEAKDLALRKVFPVALKVAKNLVAACANMEVL